MSGVDDIHPILDSDIGTPEERAAYIRGFRDALKGERIRTRMLERLSARHEDERDLYDRLGDR